jgi:hypothetical protein
VPVKGVHHDRDAAEPRGDPAESPRLGRVGVYDVRPEAPHLGHKAEERPHILTAVQGSTEAGYAVRRNLFPVEDVDHLGLARRHVPREEA